MNSNFAFIQGVLPRDPYVTHMRTGNNTLLKFTVAQKETFRANDGSAKESSNYVECIKWTDHPDDYLDFMVKGNRVTVHGTLRTESWEKDGKKFSKLVVKADSIEPMREPKRNQEPPSQSANEQGQADKPETHGKQNDDSDSNVPF